MEDSQDKKLLHLGLEKLGAKADVTDITDLSPNVSQNSVFQITLGDGRQLIAKISNFGEYNRFLEDHTIIHQWVQLLKPTPYQKFLAVPVTSEQGIFNANLGDRWLVMYHKAPKKTSLPKIPTTLQVEMTVAVIDRKIANVPVY